jgi:NAD(P)-dependent dehydrogenase (short-subunit alcohol dehydrogenase family)
MTQSKRLEGKVAIITGAASGIGRATAILFAREGARLALGDMNEDALKEVVLFITKQGFQAIMKKTDVANEDEVKGLIDVTIEAYSQVDIVCNNAGVVGDISTIDAQNAAVWRSVLNVNLMGAVYTTKHIATHMQARRCGPIVNVASVAGIRSGAGGNAYSASKAALINFTQTSACDLEGFNIRVNAVCPGLIETGMTKPVFDYARQKGNEKKLGSRSILSGTIIAVFEAIDGTGKFEITILPAGFTSTTAFFTFFYFLLISQFISCYGASYETTYGYHTGKKDAT